MHGHPGLFHHILLGLSTNLAGLSEGSLGGKARTVTVISPEKSTSESLGATSPTSRGVSSSVEYVPTAGSTTKFTLTEHRINQCRQIK